MNNASKEIAEAIDELNEEAVSVNEKISLIESLDISKPVTQDKWHAICETPLRGSNLLKIIVKNTFPLAENITIGCNYVYFEMLGFDVQIPTFRSNSINVDTSWYCKDHGEPVCVYDAYVENMIEYFHAVDNKLGWYECAKHRIQHGKTYKKWFLFTAWWMKYRWKAPNRQEFERVKIKQEQKHKERVEKYYLNRKIIRHKAKKLLNELLPLLDEFSNTHNKFDDIQCLYSIEQIKVFEGL